MSARGKSACPRATCERRARSSGARRPLFGVLGLAYMVFAPAPSPPLVESTAHFLKMIPSLKVPSYHASNIQARKANISLESSAISAKLP